MSEIRFASRDFWRAVESDARTTEERIPMIAIIGILSSVVLASLSTARQKSRDAKRISDIGQIQLALELFFDANQSYPSSTPGIASTATIDAGVQVLANNNFLPKVPLPPAGPTINKYFYRGITAVPDECLGANACTTYALASTLERNDNTVLSADADNTVVAALAGAFNNTAASGGAASGSAGAIGTGATTLRAVTTA